MPTKQINETRLRQFISAGLDSRHYSGSLAARECIGHDHSLDFCGMDGHNRSHAANWKRSKAFRNESCSARDADEV